MASPISPIRNLPVVETVKPAAGAGQSEFRSLLENAIGNVENLRTEANQATGRFLNGENEDVHSVALSTQKAEMAFDLFLQVRNKVVEAYQEVMRMQI